MVLFKKITLANFLLLSLMPITQANAAQTIMPAPTLKWMTATDMPPGVQVAILAGNPHEKGHFVARVKFPAHYIVPAHSHPIPEYDTVIAGTYFLGEGKIADANKGIALNQGDFAYIPANSEHYGYTKQETVIQISADGPWGMVYKVNG